MQEQEVISVLEKRGVDTMKAVRIHDFGDSDKLVYETAPVPSFLPDEVLIKVHAAGVNPVDWKIRDGIFKLGHQLPLILGWDVAGTIENTGSLITQFKTGDKVFCRADLSRDGAYAEYIAVRGFELALAPGTIELQEAAGIPLAAQTAWVGLFEQGNLKKKQTVLIHGASGGVGTFAVQLAKIAGAYVIGTTSGKNVELVKSLGADEVIDYKTEDFTRKVQEVDLVFDTVGRETQAKSWAVIRKNGTLVSTVGADEKEGVKHNVNAKSFMLVSNGARLQAIAALVDKNLLRVVIDKEFPLSEVKAAHDLSKTGRAKGKIILKVQ